MVSVLPEGAGVFARRFTWWLALVAVSWFWAVIPAHGVSIQVTDMRVESGTDCGPAPTVYRFTTNAQYEGKQLDVLLTVTAEDNDLAYVHYWGSQAVEGCVAIENGYIRVDMKDNDATDDRAYMEFILQLVEHGTNDPILVDRLILTSWDLDRSDNSRDTLTDDLYVYVPPFAEVYLNAQSYITYLPGTYEAFGSNSLPSGVDGYNVRLKGRDRNCNDEAGNPDPQCRGGVVFLDTSKAFFRMQNDNAYGRRGDARGPFRRFFLGLDIEKLEDLFSHDDYGDAPQSYGEAGLEATAKLLLGPGFPPDEEISYQESEDARADDANPSDNASFDDEDAVTLDGAPLEDAVLILGYSYALQITVYNEEGYSGYLNAWVDWNADGDFDDIGERLLSNQRITDSGRSVVDLSLHVPNDATVGTSFMRFTYSQNPVSDPVATGGGKGEVEDYRVYIRRGVPVSGRLYHDLEPNGVHDPSDLEIGPSDLNATDPPNLHVKLFSDPDNDCTNGFETPAIELVAVENDGSYRLDAVAAGTYCLVLSENADANDASSYDPAGDKWLSINPPDGILPLVITQAQVAGGQESKGHDFGFFHGFKVWGTVFDDTGYDAVPDPNNDQGLANDAVQNGDEPGIAGVTVRASAGTHSRSTETGPDGRYTLYIPYDWGNGDVILTHDLRPASGYNQDGTSDSAYRAASFEEAVASDSAAARINLGSAQDHSGDTLGNRNFGVVYFSEFRPDQTGSTTTPGTIVYRHTYKPGTQEQVTLSSEGGDYSYQVRVDANCDGDFGDEGESWQTISGSNTVSFEVTDSWPRNPDGSFKACAVEVRVLVPDGEPEGAVDIVAVKAALLWEHNENDVVDLTRVVDTTTVRILGTVELEKLGCNVTNAGSSCAPEDFPTGYSSNVSGKPGDELEYCIEYRNIGSSAVSEVKIQDPVPFFAEAVGEPDPYRCGSESGDIYWRDAAGGVHCLDFDADDGDNGELSAEGGVVYVRTEATLEPGERGLVCYRVRIR